MMSAAFDLWLYALTKKRPNFPFLLNCMRHLQLEALNIFSSGFLPKFKSVFWTNHLIIQAFQVNIKVLFVVHMWPHAAVSIM